MCIRDRPAFACGEAVDLTYNYTVAGDCATEMCNSTFAVAASTALSVSCPANVSLPACTSEADILAAYNSWIAAFTFADGCNPAETSTAPPLPAFACGGAVDLTYNYTVAGDCTTETCNSTFAVAAGTLSVSCPAAMSLACSDQTSILTAYNTWVAGFTFSGGCNASVTSTVPSLPTFGTTVNLSYTYTVTGDCGTEMCTSTFEVMDNPTCSASNSGLTCAGQDLTLMETGGDATSWNWTGPGGFTSTMQNPIVSPGVAGVYTVIITDGDGCTSTCTTTVAEPPTPSCGTFPANPPTGN